MVWFIVDDGFHSHRKAVRAGADALGLWVLAGSWSADQLTDGWVPDYIAARFDPQYEQHAAALVRAGLWQEGERDSDHGWLFHQWGEFQQSAEKVKQKREEARERMRRVRANKKRTSREVRDGLPTASPNEREQGASNVGDVVRDALPTNGSGTQETGQDRAESGAVRGAFARTDGELREKFALPDTDTDTDTERTTTSSSPAAKTAHDDDPDWLKFWSVYPRRVGKAAAQKAWAKALRSATAADIIAGAERYRDDPNRSAQYTKHPTTWLNQGCWDDEPEPPRLRAVGADWQPYRNPDPDEYERPFFDER